MLLKMKKYWKTTAAIALGSLGLIALGWYIFANRNPVVDNVATVEAKRGNITVSVEGTGTVQPLVSRSIAAKVGGTLTKVYFKSGQQVKKGELLLAIDDEDARMEVEKAAIDLQQAQLEREVTLKQVRQQEIAAPIDGEIAAISIGVGQEVQRNAVLMIIQSFGANGPATAVRTETGGTVQNLYVKEGDTVKKGDRLVSLSSETINGQLTAQDLRVKKAELTLKSLQKRLEDYKIYAPVAGVVTMSDDQPGAGNTITNIVTPTGTATTGTPITIQIQVGDEVNPGQTLAIMQGSEGMMVTVPVDEVDIGKLKVGQKADVNIEALPEREITGKVNQIAAEGKTQSGVANFDVRVSIGQPAGVKAGMTANAEVLVKRKENVLLIPIEAVQEKMGRRYVALATDRTTGPARQQDTAGKLKPVDTGLYNENVIEIQSGLKEGDKVILPGVTRKPTERRGIFGSGPGRPPR